MKKPHVLFAIGDIDWRYARGKLRQMVEKVAAEGRWRVTVASPEEDICQAFTNGEVKTIHMPVKVMPHLPEHSIEMTDVMIRYTGDVSYPESRLPLWKTIALDDYMGCMSIAVFPPLPIKPDVLVYPLVGIDNSTASSSHFYTAMALEARKAGAPIVGLEVSPLGNRQTLAASLADYYAVKTEFSRSFLVAQELAPAERISILPSEESYLLTCRTDPFLDEYCQQEPLVRQRLGIAPGQVVVFVPHNVAFVYETRRILKSLQSLRFPVTIVLTVTPSVTRHSLTEKEIVEKSYREELKGLPNLVLDEAEGWLWTLLVSDVVLTPVCSVFTELAAFYGKLTIVSNAWGDRTWVGENLFVEPEAQRAMDLIHRWVEKRVLQRKKLSAVLDALLNPLPAQIEPRVAHGS
jgi:hypothetical protein